MWLLDKLTKKNSSFSTNVDKAKQENSCQQQEDEHKGAMDKLSQRETELGYGYENNLHRVYEYVISADPEIADRAAGIISVYMQSRTPFQIIRLSDTFREYTSMEWGIEWKEIDPADLKKTITKKEDYLWVMRLGTFHPNGFFREKCIRELKDDPDSIAYLILRYNDWSYVVRKEAVQAAGLLFGWITENVYEVLPYIEKIRRSYRRNEEDLKFLEDVYSKKVYSFYQASGWNGLSIYDAHTRRVAYRLLTERDLLHKDAIKEIVQKEKSGQCLRLIVHSFVQKSDVDIDDLDELMKSKSAYVQRKAMEKKYELLLDYWEGLEEMLLSPSKSIRGTVAFILRNKTKIDIRSYYYEHLNLRGEAQKAICILGIGENGTESDADELAGYLENGNAGIVKSALHAIGCLHAGKYSEVFWKYLQDDRIGVMIQAYHEILAHDITFGAERVYQLFCTTKSIELKKRLAKILSKESYWDRLPYLLMLYDHENAEIRRSIFAGLQVKNMYNTISKEKAEWILGIMNDEKYAIPEWLKKKLAFDLKCATKG